MPPTLKQPMRAHSQITLRRKSGKPRIQIEVPQILIKQALWPLFWLDFISKSPQ